MVGSGFTIGDWCWFIRQATPCRVVERQDVWGEVVYRIWLPAKDAVVRARAVDLAPLESVRPSVEQILHTTAAAKLLDSLEDNLLLAPIQSSVVPLPHQLYALNRAVSRDRIRYLLADEVGLGKTIEAGLVLRELKLRGRVKRILVVAPKGLVRQWQAEMRLHFGEKFQFIEPSELAAFRQWRSGGVGEEENLWRMHDQVICSLDSVKPLEGRRGWSLEQLNTYNRERFEDLISASWDLVIIDEAHRMGGSTEQVARYKLGAALAEASPYLLLLSATPHQGKTDQFMRLMQLLDREAFPDESSVSRDRVRPFVIRTEKRASINAEGQPLFKPRVTRLQAVAWQARHSSQQRLYEAVTDYVRHGYNQAMAAKQRHIGFLMILMQRLVTSSTAAIRTTSGEAPGSARCATAAGQPVRGHKSGRVGRSRWPIPGGSGHAVQWLGTGEVRSRNVAGVGARNRGRRHRRQGRGAAGADLQTAARGKRRGAEGADLHRVRAHPSDAGRTIWRAVVSRWRRSTAAWTWKRARGHNRCSPKMCAC